MKKHTLKIALCTVALSCFASHAAADVTINIINSTSKPAEFSLMVLRSTTYSKLSDGQIPANETRQFSSSQLLPKCNDSWRCAKLKAVIQHWGSHVLFVACPKIYNSRKKTQTIWYKISGNDSSSLLCRRSKKPKKKTDAQQPTG
jgi:hypothetical protein